MKKFFSLMLAVAAMSALFAQTTTKATHNLTIGIAYIWQDEMIDTVWGFTLTEINDQYAFNFIIYCDSIVPGVTYTLADMDPNYSYGMDYNYHAIRYDSAEITLNMTGDQRHIAVWMVDRNGNSWNMHYDELGPEDVRDTVEIGISAAHCSLYDDTEGDSQLFQFTGDNEDYMVYLACYSTSVAGSYTTNDFSIYYTGILQIEEDDTVMRSPMHTGRMVVTATDNGYSVEAYITCRDSMCYHVGMFYDETGIAEASEMEVSVFPNPASERLTVVGTEEGGSLELVNMLGQRVLQQKVSGKAVELYVGGLERGAYILRLHSAKGTAVKKVVLR